MAWTIPTLREMAERAASSFNANLRGADAKLFPNNVYVSAKVIAGAVWEGLSFVAYIKRQIFVHSADGEHLDKHATDYGMARLAATYASGYVELTGVDGTTIAAGELLQRTDGARYTITGGGTVAAGVVSVLVQADTAGSAGNSVSGVAMSLVTPTVGFDGTGTVEADGIGGGADTESDEALRTRLLQRKQNPPRGGSTADYVAWALAVNGVSDVYVDPITLTNGRTSVGVWFLMWGVYPNGIPQGADVTNVEAYIDSQRPAGAVVSVAAPTAVTVAVTATNVSPLTADVIDAINIALADLFRRAVRVSTVEEPYKLWRSQISEAIATATGEDHHVLTVPATDVTYTTGQYPVLGTVTLS
jgi:uncharacterized phage protein gp47/JayE